MLPVSHNINQIGHSSMILSFQLRYYHPLSRATDIIPVRRRGLFTGFGDGFYATYIGRDSAGKICQLLTDFDIVLWRNVAK
ncbi:DUF4241 domain-containing protein [Sphingobacterium zeae]|uniref:DUF4241 domain-containing protein n=1 Tax=Sphingobacterium zeae TaxID=1776859 RepID=UPI0036204A19